MRAVSFFGSMRGSATGLGAKAGEDAALAPFGNNGEDDGGGATGLTGAGGNGDFAIGGRGAGGRAGKTMRAVSRVSVPAPGGCGFGGNAMRTVSFFGWVESAIRRPKIVWKQIDQKPTACHALTFCLLKKCHNRLVKMVATVAEAQRQPSTSRVLVPTMGALHKAHGELIRAARERAGGTGEVIVSIFVNPLQFEPGSDYEKYPRPEKADEEFCRAAGVDLLFRPSAAELYTSNHSVFVDETALSGGLEGKSRPGHFRGVCTVVAKLFNILRPDAAVFGEKDFQQLAIVRRMVRDLNFAIDIIAVPTVREADGLACSSRNQYLNTEERKQAGVLHQALVAARKSGQKSTHDIVATARMVIAEAPLARIDHVEVVDAETLQPIGTLRPNSLLALAVFFGKTRLIDNIRLP
jgi:pantoate--beta-alanine ligase